MYELILDLETKRAFSETGKYDPRELGVSFVGLCRRQLGLEQRSEGKLLGFFEDRFSELWPILEQARRIVGFNIVGFDFPALSAYYHGNLAVLPVLDILEQVKAGSGHRVSLNAIALASLGRQKVGSGLDALAYYEQGRLEELSRYCLEDVRLTRDVYDYGQEYGHLKFLNKWNRVIQVPVDFSFKDEGETKVQMSLGV